MSDEDTWHILRDAFGTMPTRKTIVARLCLLGAITGLIACGILIMAAYTWIVLWIVK